MEELWSRLAKSAPKQFKPRFTLKQLRERRRDHPLPGQGAFHHDRGRGRGITPRLEQAPHDLFEVAHAHQDQQRVRGGGELTPARFPRDLRGILVSGDHREGGAVAAVGDGTQAVLAPASGCPIFIFSISAIRSGMAHIPFPIWAWPGRPQARPTSTFQSS